MKCKLLRVPIYNCHLLIALRIISVLLFVANVNAAPYLADGFYKNLDISVSRENNMSRAWIDADAVSDSVTSVTLGAGVSQRPTENSLLVVSGYARANAFSQYDDLNSLYLSLGAHYLFQISAGYNASAYNIGLNAIKLVHENSPIRNGEIIEITFGATKRLSSVWSINMTYDHRLRFAEGSAFSIRNHSVTLSPEYKFSNNFTMYADFEYLQGGMTATARGEIGTAPASLLALELSFDPVFKACVSCENWAYRYEGKGYHTTLGFTHQFPKALTLDWAVKYSDVEADIGIGYADWSAMLGLVWYF